MIGGISGVPEKLLEKVILLATVLERKAASKFTGVNFNCWRKRRLILLTALSVISKKSGVGSKLLQLDWLIELLSQVFCKVKLEVSLKIIKSGGGGLKKFIEDLRLAKKLQALQAMRAALRRDTGLKMKLICDQPQKFLLTIDNRRRALQAQSNAKLELEIANLRLEDPEHELAVKRNAIHVWRCLLNLRLVKARTRKRLKASITARWRKSTRVSTIAGIYYGKKVKLRLMNRWFSKRFGRAKEHQLTVRLNDFVAKKKRRAMFLTREEVYRSHSLTAKGLLQLWRREMQGRRAEAFYSQRLAQNTFRKVIGIFSLHQGRAQSSRLYNEIRLIKNVFYSWFSRVIPDRVVFARDRAILGHKERKIKAETLQKWVRKSRSVYLLQQHAFHVQKLIQQQKLKSSLGAWSLLTKQHAARLIWTENFRVTEDLRAIFGHWRQEAKNQIAADTKYQFNLCFGALKVWRGLFSSRQDERFAKKHCLNLWRASCQGRRGLRFLHGQRLLRRLTGLKATNSALNRVLELSVPDQAETPQHQQESKASKKIVALYKWRNMLKRAQSLEDCGDLVQLDRFRKVLQIWRLETAEAALIRHEPQRLLIKSVKAIKKWAEIRQIRTEELESRLFNYYAARAVQLEGQFFHRWETAFQVTQVGQNCCLKLLKRWEEERRDDLFRRWQVQTAGIIHSKCKRITSQQNCFSVWRKSCADERNRRNLRICSKQFQNWRRAFHQRDLENREIRFRHLRSKLKGFSQWKSSRKQMKESSQKAEDFFFIVRTSRAIDLWKQKLEALRTARSKTQTLMLLRAPVVRKPRIEQLMANAISLSDLSSKEVDDSGNLIMENLNIAELSV